MKHYPIQKSHKSPREKTTIPEPIYLAAYEVYEEVYGKQPALIDHDRGCRGGFGISELVAYLYARAFPKTQWRIRVHEAHDHIDLG